MPSIPCVMFASVPARSRACAERPALRAHARASLTQRGSRAVFVWSSAGARRAPAPVTYRAVLNRSGAEDNLFVEREWKSDRGVAEWKAEEGTSQSQWSDHSDWCSAIMYQ